jgi:hypothetical protein
MRERSTWNLNVIAKKAAEVAGDIYTMNQDRTQPAMDKYVIGDSSDFAEDVHSPNTWEAEYSGEAVKRNELGMPEFRSDTFNHSEKTASEHVRLKKAELCVAVAKLMMRGKRTASAEAIEDQAVALMYMPDRELINTHKRLAQEQAQQDDDDDDDEGQSKQAGEIPPQFKENIEKMKAKSKDSDDDDEGQSKQAGQDDDDDEIPEFIQKKIDDSKDEKSQGEKKQAKMVKKIKLAMGQQQQLLAQMQQLLQQAQGQQQQEQVAPQAPVAQQQDDLDQLLANSDLGPTAESDIELDAPGMDVSDAGLGGEDEILRTLFAQDQDQSDDEEDETQQQAKQAAVRTASTRTVGTRPTAGVAKLGGSVSKTASRNQVDSLSSLWATAPDVRAAFGMK